jgi:hypothetical protein
MSNDAYVFWTSSRRASLTADEKKFSAEVDDGAWVVVLNIYSK